MAAGHGKPGDECLTRWRGCETTATQVQGDVTMDAELHGYLAFHLTGRQPGKGGRIDEPGLRPALFAGFRDLARLRYDFPLVLTASGEDGSAVQSLSALFDRIVEEIASGAEGERVRKHALRLEQEIRVLAAEGAGGKLIALLDTAASRLSAHNDELFQDSLKRLRVAIKIDGDVVDCDRAMPFRLFHHAWTVVHARRARAFRKDVDRLVARLSDILAADFVHSPEGLSADRLKASVGAVHREAFDFAAMATLLAEASPRVPLPDSRRQRIQSLISVLKSQRFFPAAGGNGSSNVGVTPYDLVFDSCAEAVNAYRERLSAMTEVARALAIAELESEGRYNGLKHDLFFQEFGANGLDPSELARFPDYLIVARADLIPDIVKAVSAGLPAKVMIQSDDLFESSAMGGEDIVLALGAGQLAATAVALGTLYVLQSSSSNLFQLREQVFRGLAHPGPALFHIFSGATGEATYLTAAAAMESRAFPAFTYDPSAGPDLASRFALANNPQPERDWPIHPVAFEDEEHQRQSEIAAFTLVDFAAHDPRYAGHFAPVPRSKWNAGMVPIAEFLAGEAASVSDRLPYLLMIDDDDQLQRVIVDQKLIRATHRCAEMWRSLQELGGVRNSHAARLLVEARQAWEEEQRRSAPAPVTNGQDHAAAPVASPVLPAAAGEPAEAERSPDEPYIETARCTSCNECTQINDKMFAYDANKQASIVNPDAGTYRQLVEAAESCQVSIIHPGKPRNSNEPGLDELLQRAEAFR